MVVSVYLSGIISVVSDTDIRSGVEADHYPIGVGAHVYYL